MWQDKASSYIYVPGTVDLQMFRKIFTGRMPSDNIKSGVAALAKPDVPANYGKKGTSPDYLVTENGTTMPTSKDY